MVDILFYDEQHFKPEKYAQAWGMVTTRLNHCLSKGFIEPERHDYGTVYFLIKDSGEVKFRPIIDSHRARGFNVEIHNRVLPYNNKSPDEIRGQLRIMRVFKPFDDIKVDENLDKLLAEEKKIQKEEKEKGNYIADPLGLDNALGDMLKQVETKNAKRSRKRK